MEFQFFEKVFVVKKMGVQLNYCFSISNALIYFTAQLSDDFFEDALCSLFCFSGTIRLFWFVFVRLISLCLQPCLPIVQLRRSQESVDDIGTNELVQWRPDSSCIAVAVSETLKFFYYF